MSSAPILRANLAASLLALACVVASPAAAGQAAKRPERAPPAQAVEPAASEPSAAWTAGTAPADCTRARRKLWQPEQGWIVKSVTTCH